jgi:hypothetical protein
MSCRISSCVARYALRLTDLPLDCRGQVINELPDFFLRCAMVRPVGLPGSSTSKEDEVIFFTLSATVPVRCLIYSCVARYALRLPDLPLDCRGQGNELPDLFLRCAIRPSAAGFLLAVSDTPFGCRISSCSARNALRLRLPDLPLDCRRQVQVLLKKTKSFFSCGGSSVLYYAWRSFNKTNAQRRLRMLGQDQPHHLMSQYGCSDERSL